MLVKYQSHNIYLGQPLKECDKAIHTIWHQRSVPTDQMQPGECQRWDSSYLSSFEGGASEGMFFPAEWVSRSICSGCLTHTRPNHAALADKTRRHPHRRGDDAVHTCPRHII